MGDREARLTSMCDHGERLPKTVKPTHLNGQTEGMSIESHLEGEGRQRATLLH